MPMPTELIQVITTTAEKADAQTLANMLLEKRLAACTQIQGPLESSYWWNNRLDTVREWQVVMKTRGDLFKQVEALLLEHHPYDEPEILSVSILNVSAGYRAWLIAQLAVPVVEAKDKK